MKNRTTKGSSKTRSMGSNLYTIGSKSISLPNDKSRSVINLFPTNAFKVKVDGTKHLLIVGDCVENMRQIPSESVDLIITDPPYNVGLHYGGYNDNLNRDKYFEWCKVWLTECARVLKKNGNMFIVNYPENNAYLMPFLDKELKLVFRRWLTWHYPTNIGHSKNNFTRSQRSILFYSKSKNSKFFTSEILQPHRNPDHKRIKQLLKNSRKGKKPYDAFKLIDLLEIQKGNLDFLEFNLVKNVSKYGNGKILNHPCVMPKDLIKVLMNAGSRKGDIVLDPFSGAFTVSVASVELGRNSIGIDLNPEYVEIGMKRLKQVE